MLPVELQNAYIRSEGVHGLTHLAAVHNELAQRHLSQRLQEERDAQSTQIQSLSESENSPNLKPSGDEDGSGGALPGRRYGLERKKGGKPRAIITDSPLPGSRLDITI